MRSLKKPEEPRRPALEVFFRPQSVAVIGATEEPDHLGNIVMSNLARGSLGQKLFPINPTADTIYELQAYPTIGDVPERVDLAVIVAEAPDVLDIVIECAEARVRGAIITSADFKVLGDSRADVSRQIVAEARRADMRLLGPDSLGVMMPHTGLNATWAGHMAYPGNVAFISQSAAMATAILDWSLKDRVGFSTFASVGGMLDLDLGDLITYLGHDYRTKSIVVYMEAVGDARSFLSAIREVAFNKPVVILRGGHTEAAAQVAAFHTGALIGSDEAFDAALRRSGALRVGRVSNLFYMAEVLAKQPRPRGPNLTILTNAGGPGILATDTLLRNGGQLTPLTPESVEALDAFLPNYWDRKNPNPIDIQEDADPERYLRAIDIAANDPNSDGLLVILTPQHDTQPAQIAEALKKNRPGKNRPLLTCWMGGAGVAAGNDILNQANIATFEYPDTAARVFVYMWQYDQNMQSLYETPRMPPEFNDKGPDRDYVGQVIEKVRAEGRTILTELESKQLLAAYNIPTVKTHLAADVEDAVRLAEEIGYPVVLKLHSQTIIHASDVGGVCLNLPNADAVRMAYNTIKRSVTKKASPEDFLGVTVQPMIFRQGYELILGSSIDEQFGPIVVFGWGGELVEVFKDRALGLPPLTSTLALRMMQKTRIYEALQGIRGRPPVDLIALEQTMVRFSHLIAEQRWIKELDINPLLVSPEGVITLDARVLLHPPDQPEESLPRLAIRPYPYQYITHWQLKDGSPVIIRPIQAEDEPLVAKFHQDLSDESVYSRFFRYMPLSRRIAHERLSRICFVDYDQEMALVAEYKNPETDEFELLGIGRLIKLLGANDVEFAVLVSDKWQGHGIGYKLMQLLIDVGHEEGYNHIVGTILPENYGMQHICRKLGFIVERSPEDNVMEAVLPLKQLPQQAPQQAPQQQEQA